MKVYVLMFGFEYEGYDCDVRVFASREVAEAEGEKVLADEEGTTFDYFYVKEVEVE
jgi:hypothetical protein